MSYVLAIDLGTSGPKVGVVSARGEVRGHAFAPTTLHLLPDGGAEQDPEEWWRAVVTASREALGRSGVAAREVVAVSVTAQWSGTVPVDAQGRAIGRALIWMDSRGRRHVERLRRGVPSVQGYGLGKLLRWIRVTGGAPGAAGKDPIAHILWLREASPEIYARADKLLEPKDYLNARLTGVSRATYDSIALHWLTDNRDLTRVRYHPTLVRQSGVDAEKLPQLVAATDVIGTLTPEAASELGLSPSAQVIGGTPDMQSAILGSGAARDYGVHAYLGTGSWLCSHVPFKKTDLSHNIATLPSALPRRYFVAAAQESAGVCLSTSRRLFTDDALSYEALLELAARAEPGSSSLLFLPWLYGERAPVEDATLRGAFVNLSLATSRAELVRSVLEGVAYNSRWLLAHVERLLGRDVDAVHMVGGGARSELWCRIYADVLQRPVVQMAEPILVNVRGAALLASVALGEITPEELDACAPVAKRFEPEAGNGATYDRLFEQFMASHRQTRGIMRRLNQRTTRS